MIKSTADNRARGKPQHCVSSKLMCWVALDRASRLADIRGHPETAATWRATADEIRKDVLAHGVSDRGVLRQHYETDALDASTLLAGSFNFLPHDDKRLRNTVLAVAEELTDHGFVLRRDARNFPTVRISATFGRSRVHRRNAD